MQTLFDDPETARKAARITAGIMQGRSPRLSDIAWKMPGNEVANYKVIQRFLDGIAPQEVLSRLFREEAPYPAVLRQKVLIVCN
jgi:hypothetical protein